jgi:hypothetical protein
MLASHNILNLQMVRQLFFSGHGFGTIYIKTKESTPKRKFQDLTFYSAEEVILL